MAERRAPAESEPNGLGLTDPGGAARRWQAVSALIVETPIGWPIAWIVVAIVALRVCRTRPADPVRHLATALLVSALTLEASFAVLSIASDLRYHLWSMIATALAVVMLADRPPPPSIVRAGMAALLIVVAAGIVTRLTLPYPPQNYAGMLG